LVVAVTEAVYYFPLTPLSLDVAGETRLPEAAGRARLLFVGDILLGDRGRWWLERWGYDHPFGSTRQLIRQADLAVGNLEGPVAVRARRNRRKRWSYKMPPRAARALQRAGFDAVDLANNHIRDCGDAGLRETLRHVRAAGLRAFGAGRRPREAHRAARVTVRGVRVALLGYIAPEQMMRGDRVSLRHHRATRRRGGAAWGGLGRVRRDVRRARRRGAHLVIVSLHAGDRYQREPRDFERVYAEAVIDAGADAVVAHGTHILGPVGRYRGKPILYGVGNFAFGSGNVRARFGLMAFLEVDVAKRRLVAVQALPIYTVNLNPWVLFQTRVLVGRQARRVLQGLIRRSWRYGARLRLQPRPWRAVLAL
jgi:poly-gamma-glutamate synthesis protein (capsule biosynthesis protein)